MKMQRKTSEAGRRDRRSIMPKRGAVLQRMKKSRHAINQRTPDTQCAAEKTSSATELSGEPLARLEKTEHDAEEWRGPRVPSPRGRSPRERR